MSKQSQLNRVGEMLNILTDGRDWVYNGVSVDYGTDPSQWGHCACGHHIRYAFGIRNEKTGEVTQLGTTCIQVFKHYNPDTHTMLLEAVKKITDNRTALQVARDKAFEDPRVQKLVEKLRETRQAIKSRLSDLDYSVVRVWGFFHLENEVPSNWKTTSSYIKWFEHEIKTLQDWLVDPHLINVVIREAEQRCELVFKFDGKLYACNVNEFKLNETKPTIPYSTDRYYAAEEQALEVKDRFEWRKCPAIMRVQPNYEIEVNGVIRFYKSVGEMVNALPFDHYLDASDSKAVIRWVQQGLIKVVTAPDWLKEKIK